MNNSFSNNMIMIGFGSIGRAVLPLLFRYFNLTPSQLTIYSKEHDGQDIANQFGIRLCVEAITQENYYDLLNHQLNEGDFLINLSVGVSSFDLVEFCQSKNVLYIDTCSEPWLGGYVDSTLPPALRTNYALRETIIAKKGQPGKTAVITHGANPGLVSHFVKQALLNMAHDNGLNPELKTSTDWAALASKLNIKSIQIAERDSQSANKIKQPQEFVNTWSINGFVAESIQPAELGWGTHERHWPQDACSHEFGSQCAIYLNRPGASTKVRTWTPTYGASHGFLITHSESISIADYLTLKKEDDILYRPTVYYAYTPCPDAILSLHELAANEWRQQPQQRLIFDEILEGQDELGVLLMGNKMGAYWYGSQLSIQEARERVAYNNATSLQVAIGVLTGMLWAIENPEQGIVEPEDLDHYTILEAAKPYLGNLAGYYTDWNPLQNRDELFQEIQDHSDPWQFLNIRVV